MAASFKTKPCNRCVNYLRLTNSEFPSTGPQEIRRRRHCLRKSQHNYSTKRPAGTTLSVNICTTSASLIISKHLLASTKLFHCTSSCYLLFVYDYPLLAVHFMCATELIQLFSLGALDLVLLFPSPHASALCYSFVNSMLKNMM